MGDPQAVALWLVSNIERLDVQIERLGWVDRLLPGMVDVGVHLNVRGETLSGWGAGNSADLALAKATAEILERLILFEHKFPTSNGLAAHSRRPGARFNAEGELRERDLLLCHFLTGTPLALPPHDPVNEFGLKSLEDWFGQRGVKLLLRALGTSGYVAALDGREAAAPFGFILGAAMKSDLQASVLSACMEATRFGYRLLMGSDVASPLSLDEFLNLKKPDFSDHGLLALNLEYANSISWLFDPGVEFGAFDNADLPVLITDVENTLRDLTDCPLAFARATSAEMQDLFVGRPSPEVVNLERLSRFLGREFTWAEVVKLPHPLA